jgi:hypothetical protein
MAKPMAASKAARMAISKVERRLLAAMASHITGLLMGQGSRFKVQRFTV